MVRLGHVEVVRYLADRRADLDNPNQRGPLPVICPGGSPIVGALIQGYDMAMV